DYPRQVFLYQHQRVRVARDPPHRPPMLHSHRSSRCRHSIMRLTALALLLLGARSQAGTYSQNFDSLPILIPSGTNPLGDGTTITGSSLSLTTAVGQVAGGINGQSGNN